MDTTTTERTAEPRSRRSFFFLGALAAAALAPSKARAQGNRARRPILPSGRFNAIVPQETGAAPAAWKDTQTRLVRRITLGATADDVLDVKRRGYQGYLLRQLQYTRIDDSAVELAVGVKYPLLAQTGDQLALANSGTLQAQLQQATIYRAALSQRQLYERMVEFWSDHFNIAISNVGYLKVLDDRNVIRPNALGKFRDLLRASAHSPAMMDYLDQNQSRVGAPNQNYAREIMELHTLGVDGGYSQNDVAELSRVLTGWTIRGKGEFYFDPNIHDWKSKSVLGVTIPAGSPALGQEGIKEGEMMLDVLVNHPSTAKFIATKMLKWLLDAEPSAAQISIVSGVYRSTGGDIARMVRAILNDAWLGSAPAKLKRPFHYLVSGVRALNPTLNATDSLNGQLNAMGQSLFLWDTPDGYPDKVEFWAGNLLPRWNYANALSVMKTASVTVDSAPFSTGGVDGAMSAINQRIFAGEMSPSTATYLRSYLSAAAFTDARLRETIALALSSSDFQWY
ncbi:MAG: hypothetical protein JWL95_2184 [Gemmatimonadetes bacterium]|nr:hypothetical protein [Gemmatimonadota bacterium]